MRAFDFVAYILAALRNVGFGDQREREEAAHDVIVQLLVSAGSTLRRLRRHQRPDGSKVQDRRAERRAEPASHPDAGVSHCRGPLASATAVGELPAHAIPDRRHDDLR